MHIHNNEEAFVNYSVFNLKTNLKKGELVHRRSLTLSLPYLLLIRCLSPSGFRAQWNFVQMILFTS